MLENTWTFNRLIGNKWPLGENWLHSVFIYGLQSVPTYLETGAAAASSFRFPA